jgi:hypothetical protein
VSANGKDRLDRMEKIVEGLLDSHLLLEQSQKSRLWAQVFLQDVTEQSTKDQKALAESHRRLDAEMEALVESRSLGKDTDERLNALIRIVDDLIRKRPQA